MTDKEFEEWLIDATLRKSQSLYNENRLEDAISYLILINKTYPVHEKVLGSIYLCLKTYIQRNNGMPNQKVINFVESGFIEMGIGFSVYIMDIGSVSIRVVKTYNTITNSFSIILHWIRGDGVEEFVTPTNLIPTNPSFKFNVNDEAVRDFLNSFRIMTEPGEYTFAQKSKKISILVHEQDERLSVFVDSSIPVTLIKTQDLRTLIGLSTDFSIPVKVIELKKRSGYEIFPERSPDRVDFWLGERSDPEDETKVA